MPFRIRVDVEGGVAVFGWTMSASRKTLYAALGTVLTLAGVAGGFVMFLQPWGSCPEIDNSSAGCPATGSDQGLLGVAVLVLLVGIVLLAMSISIRREQIPSDAAGPDGKFT